MKNNTKIGTIDNAAAKKLKSDFPIFTKGKKAGKSLVYLDNAATTQKPTAVIRRVTDFYERTNANIHRGMYNLSLESTAAYEDARKAVAGFVNADVDEIIFTRGATESLNLLAYTIEPLLDKSRKKILLTELEHHANLIPWQELARKTGRSLEFVKLGKDFMLDESDLKKKLTSEVALFAFTAVSNTLGSRVDVNKFCSLARKAGAFSIVDAAQLAPHSKIDVKSLGCDFLAFSSHKMLGPSGVGALFGRRELLQMLAPFNFGGSMISEVTYTHASFAQPPAKFEAGTPNLEGAVGFAQAIQYLESLGLENIERWEAQLHAYAMKKLSAIKQVELYNAGAGKSAGIISFNVKGVHAHDISSLLNDSGICVRAGHHCTMPLIKKLGLSATVRASFYFYNTFEDVDALASGLLGVIKLFGKPQAKK